MGKPKPKIEVRSKTGQPYYRRAGKSWTPQWTAIDESEFTAEQRKVLQDDPYLEFRVNGKRLLGESPEEVDEVDAEMALKVANLTSSVDALSARNDELGKQVIALSAGKAAIEEKLAKLTTAKGELEENFATIALENDALTNKVKALEAAAAAAVSAPAPAASEPAAAPASAEPPKGSKPKS